MKLKRTSIRVTISLLFVLCVRTASAYSILAHEALIDSCWASYIQPLLLSKYPGSTPDELKKAHAYAYGGAIAPDIGYFPFGKPFFTDLVHYVRSGDFVNALISDARDLNEYAFAIGFLCHYMADKYGHSLATNKCVPLLYPKEREKFGNYVTYEEDHLSHKRTEFGFDVLQVMESDYARLAYHNFIGFEVSGPLLERAFPEVYGMDIHDIFPNFDLSIATLRWSFKRLFPALTKAAWFLKNKELKKAHPGMKRRNYVYSFKRSAYYKEFGKDRQKPGLFSAVIAFFVEIVPKIGPLRPLKFKAPSAEVVKLYHCSFDSALVHYESAVKGFREGTRRLANIDFDTGNFTTPGEYGLCDKNYDLLVAQLEKNNFKLLSKDLRHNVIEYYSHRTPPTGSRKVQDAWNKTEEGLRELREAKTTVSN